MLSQLLITLSLPIPTKRSHIFSPPCLKKTAGVVLDLVVASQPQGLFPSHPRPNEATR